MSFNYRESQSLPLVFFARFHNEIGFSVKCFALVDPGGRGRRQGCVVPSPVQFFFIFMQCLGKIGQNNSLVPLMENPGSVTVLGSYQIIIDRTELSVILVLDEFAISQFSNNSFFTVERCPLNFSHQRHPCNDGTVRTLQTYDLVCVNQHKNISVWCGGY